MALSSKKNTVYHDVPCPFCSLLCDDLTISNQAGKLKVMENGCHKAVQQFEKEQTRLIPKIDGKECTLQEAIKQAIKILKKSRQPLINGLATDVNGVRSALALAEKTGAIVDHMHSIGAFRNLRVLQDKGWIMTTLAEIKNRADLVIFAGTDAATNYPRFYERAIWNDFSLAKNNNKRRQIIYIGDNLDSSPAKKTGGKIPINISCKQDQIGEIVSTLHALVVGNEINKTTVAGIKLAELEKLVVMMKKSRYGVIVWAPGELNFPHAELTVQSIGEMVKYLNRTTRFTGFSLGGNDGGVTANSVCAWQSGYPLRINYGKGYPEYDPYKYSAAKVLKRMEVDAMLWISGFNSDIKPPNAKIPTILLSSNEIRSTHKPYVFIPTGVPGVNHGGQLFRTDSIVSLKLKKVIDDNKPGAAEIIEQILQGL